MNKYLDSHLNMYAKNEIFGDATNGLALFGFLVSTCIVCRLLISLVTMVRAYGFGSSVDFRKSGEWAVVTGATDGIGKAYTQELAQRGMSIVLISRNPEKLQRVASEIESAYNVRTKWVAIDFSAGPEIYDKIRKEIANMDIGVLVNNVGMAYFVEDFFLNIPYQRLLDMISVNITSMAMMTKIVLHPMVERRRGIILNISSGSAVRPTPLYTNYCAAKAFVDFFSRALQAEVRYSGITVQSVLPYYVKTSMSRFRTSNWLVLTPSGFVKSAMETVGVQDRTFGAPMHELQGFLTGLLPDRIFEKVCLWLIPKIVEGKSL